MATSAQFDWRGFWPQVDFAAAAKRLEGVTQRTPIVELPSPAPHIQVLGKLENRQVGRAFKARGAWNNLVQWTAEQRARGAVAASSGNHGMAMAWAAQRLSMPCTLCMPDFAYASKVNACRELGAKVLLFPTRPQAEEACDQIAAQGAQRVHAYDAERTIEGAGTVGLEIGEELGAAVDVVLVQIGGGGLAAGTSLALRRAWGSGPEIWGVEPEGAAGMTMALQAGHSVPLEKVESSTQGLTSPFAGERCRAIAAKTLTGVLTLSDQIIEQACERLTAAGETVELAGAASYAALLQAGNRFVNRPVEIGGGKFDAKHPLRVLVVVSGGNR